MQNTVFIDTSAFAAIYNRKDQYHEAAQKKLAVLDRGDHLLVTSNYIVNETLTLLLAREGFEPAFKFGKRVFEGRPDFHIRSLDWQDDISAWQIFKKYNRDKKWSFVDCTSYALMKDMEIKTVFTFDNRDFRQMGFKIL
ncbi:PIN domain-containing protein [Candidatus Curtissbacteria bacterium]|nr:PIN domain-containing protein [Candidatus Curtissbacteria bacterium]